MSNGTLYLVGTPIGNLEDISFRAVRILKEVDLIAAEDTRTSGVLLQRYGISTALRSYHSHNLQHETPRLIRDLQAGKNIAQISDAGTPGISDPGYHLVQAALQAGITVVPIPGAVAFIQALIVSGLPTDAFVFEGFLPQKKGRQKRLKELEPETRTMVFYESVHRLQKTLQEMQQHWGERQCVLGREISKMFEEFIRGSFGEILQRWESLNIKGEFVLVVAGKKEVKEKVNKYRKDQ